MRRPQREPDIFPRVKSSRFPNRLDFTMLDWKQYSALLRGAAIVEILNPHRRLIALQVFPRRIGRQKNASA